ncbi:MAG: glycosyltransferase [Candidatus Omnitrophica bacterium]|nr:glycosyltransferase [Candidatus Omnitrophota bacterium]
MKEGWSFVACKQALLKMGHRVEVFNVGEITFPMARSLFWRAAYKVSRDPIVNRVNRALRQFLRAGLPVSPDFVLICKGEYLLPETLLALKRQTGALLFNWQTDDYFSPTLSSKHAIRSIPIYDCIFAHAKDNLPELIRGGARRAEYLPHGADPALYHPLNHSAREPYEEEVVFVGNWRKERQAFLERLVSEDFPYRMTLWGYQWEHLPRGSPLRPYVKFEAVPWESYGRLIRRSKIALVFLVRFDTGRVVVPLRLFEIPAAGGFMLVEKGNGQAEEFYRAGEEMACFSDIPDLRAKIGYFLPNEQERFRIALAGQRRAVESGYFYTQKMERMIRVYGELCKS